MRLSTLALLGVFVVSSSTAVQAQTVYSRFASQADLADGGRLPGVQPRCFTRVFGLFYFFDDTSDQIVTYNPANAAGSRINVLVSAADLDAVGGTDVTQCRDSDAISTTVVFALSNAADQDFVFSVTPGGVTRRRVASGPAADGITGLTLDLAPSGGTIVYLAQAQAFGAPQDGVTRVAAEAVNQTPQVVLTNPDLDLVGIADSESGDLFLTSSENGVGQFQNKVVRIAFPQTAPALSVAFDPFAGPNPLFANGTDGGLEEIYVGEQGDRERLFVVNNSFGGPQGETIARFQLDGSNPVLVFTEAALVASPAAMATPTSAFTAAGETGYLGVGLTSTQNGQVSELFLVSTDTNSGQVAIFRLDVTGLPTAGEQAAAEQAGYAIELANPVRGAARVRLTQPEAADVRVSVLDALGREVAMLAEGTRAGTSEATFDASALAPGLYVVVLRSNGYALSRTVTVVR